MDKISKKEKCKKIMANIFGPATASKVDDMSENSCVDECKRIVTGFLGPEKAKIFDDIKA